MKYKERTELKAAAKASKPKVSTYKVDETEDVFTTVEPVKADQKEPSYIYFLHYFFQNQNESTVFTQRNLKANRVCIVHCT